ncbi:MAG: transcriptional repressor [Gemmatimonas sp.]|nr:transcriptional repressor [Gemmatimonas sp.]
MTETRLGQRKTKQRDTILEVIRSASGPLTVEEIHQRGQHDVPGLGIATVYRTLKLLQEAGLIETVILPTGETRYEPTELGHHHHFHCRTCDVVFDLDACPVEIPGGGSYPGGYIVEDHEITLYGTCPACHV